MDKCARVPSPSGKAQCCISGFHSQVIRAQLSSAATSSLEDLDVANRNLLCSIEDSLKLDNEARGNIDLMVDPCCNDLRDLKSEHYHKIVEITENGGKCLEKEYMVDEPSCSTPSLNLQAAYTVGGYSFSAAS